MDNLLETVIDLDEKYYINTFGKRTPVMFTHGQGMFLYSSDNKKYMDLLGGIAVNALGHANKALVNSISTQASKLIHCSNLYYIQSQAKLAQKLVNLAPGMEQVFFTNSGAESNEAAIKLARIHYYKKGTPRPKVISAINSFHGRTLATVTATGQEKYNKPFSPLIPGFEYVPFNDISAMEEKIDNTTCAVMLELIQGEGGVIPANLEYVKEVSNLCNKFDVCLIIDEVQTGVGRSGSFFLYEQYDIVPDIVTAAKSLGGGVPIGAMLCNEKLKSSFSPGDHGSTFGGNPLACAASLCVIEEIEKNNLMENAKIMGKYFIDSLFALNEESKLIEDVRGKGLMIGIVLNSDFAVQVKNSLFEKGYLVNSIGSRVIRILPALIISKADIDAFVGDLKNILNSL